jgi:hypothetical protein
MVLESNSNASRKYFSLFNNLRCRMAATRARV